MSSEVVATIKEDLERRGLLFAGAHGAFAITSRVAWALREDGWGLVHKEPGQNGFTHERGRFSQDALMLRDGTVIDLLINSETENRPAWQSANPQPPQMWRPPFNPDAGLVSDQPPRPPLEPPAVPLPPDSDDLAAIAAALRNVATQLNLLRAELLDMKEAQSGLVAGLTQLTIAQAQGLTGRLGYTLTLKPPKDT